jgi:hypothetical protein
MDRVERLKLDNDVIGSGANLVLIPQVRADFEAIVDAGASMPVALPQPAEGIDRQ